MGRRPLIWVVDDDPELRELLEEFLKKNGFEVRIFADGQEVEKSLAHERPELLVLDLMLPDIDGLEICRRLRAKGDDIPIIMLTAKSDPVDRVVGIELGADDYVGKPFLTRELTARIHAVLRRRRFAPSETPNLEGNAASFGDCRLDLASRTLWRGGVQVDMTSGEFALLSIFVRHPHQPLTRERLLELARGPGSDSFDRSVDVQISRLRKLIEPDQGKPRHIQTVWGYGYVFVPETGRASA